MTLSAILGPPYMILFIYVFKFSDSISVTIKSDVQCLASDEKMKEQAEVCSFVSFYIIIKQKTHMLDCWRIVLYWTTTV